MALSIPHTSQILAEIQEYARRQGANPYRIAISSGMPLTTVQRLLTVSTNVPVRNVEMLMVSLGLEFHVVPKVTAATLAHVWRKRQRKRSGSR